MPSARSSYYNLGLAMSVLTGVLWWVSGVLTVLDLRRTKVPPFALLASHF